MTKRKHSPAMGVVFAFLGMTFLLAAGCGDDSSDAASVTVIPKTSYFQVTIDYSNGDRYSIGRAYGRKVLVAAPDFERNADSYLKDLVDTTTPVFAIGLPDEESVTFEMMITRAQEIRKQIDPEYLAELQGFASVLTGADHDELGDGKLSINEYWILNLTPDIATSVACSAIAVYGDRSDTGQTLVGRVTDWYPGTEGQMGYLNAVIYSQNGARHMVSFGWLGILGTLVGINSDGLFLANLYSAVGSAYSAEGRRSILLDIRTALETCASIDQAADFLKDPAKIYGYNHNMFIADRNTARVLENNFNRNRALRSESSALNPGIQWGFTNALACVNSFQLLGNVDNHTAVPVNYERWANYRSQLAAQGAQVDFEGMKTIITQHRPGGAGADNGDIYGNTSVQLLVYSFADQRLQVWLHPFVPNFDENPLFMDINPMLSP